MSSRSSTGPRRPRCSPRGRRASAFRCSRACGTAGRASATPAPRWPSSCRAAACSRWTCSTRRRSRTASCGWPTTPTCWRALGQEAVGGRSGAGTNTPRTFCARSRARAPPPGWPLPAVATPPAAAHLRDHDLQPRRWLRHSLPRLLDVTRPWRDVVEVVVCDNASTDDTPEVVIAVPGRDRTSRAHRNRDERRHARQPRITARASQRRLRLAARRRRPADGRRDRERAGGAGRPSRRRDGVHELRLHAFRRARRLRRRRRRRRRPRRRSPTAGRTATSPSCARWPGSTRTCSRRSTPAPSAATTRCAPTSSTHAATPFSSLATCVPSSVYALAALQDRPAWWVGEPAVVVNMNVSWLRWALLWHLERMPDLFEEAERRGVDPERLDVYRLQHLVEAEHGCGRPTSTRRTRSRANFSLARLLERCKHLPEFRDGHLPGVRRGVPGGLGRGPGRRRPGPARRVVRTVRPVGFGP